jgi:hypothetical protein
MNHSPRWRTTLAVGARPSLALFDVALMRQNNTRHGSPIPARYGVRELAPALEGDESGVKPPHSIDRHTGRQWTPLGDGLRSRDTVLTFGLSDVKTTHSAVFVYVTCNMLNCRAGRFVHSPGKILIRQTLAGAICCCALSILP